MAVYFVIGALLVAWALILTFGGMARNKDFPDKSTGRMLMAVSAGLAIAVFAALLATTEKEHPRQEAKKEAAEERAGGEASGGKSAFVVNEKEYAIELAGGTTPHTGPLAIDVKNVGKVPHDLAIEGGGGKEPKTPLIDPGKSARLEANLKPGKYKFYCTVPGHEQLGMKTEVTVR
jgi:uncharacterized cupredoxin-like copper-binding protein